MSKTIAIVGRPNVGKSTLFNRFIGYKRAIVFDEEGITRDPVEAYFTCGDMPIRIVDTGGYTHYSKMAFAEEINRGVQSALAHCDGLILVVDGRAGLDPEDRKIYQKLCALRKPMVIAVNKADNGKNELLDPFYALSSATPVAISAEHGIGITDLLDALFEKMAPELMGRHLERSQPIHFPIAIVGRPNVGKSSLINAILGDEKMIVSDIPGTTRDSIDLIIPHNEKTYIVIDTAGIRKNASRFSPVEHYAMLRAEASIERSKISILVIDAALGLGAGELRLLSHIQKLGKGCIVFVNKWDLITGMQMERYKKELIEACPFLEETTFIFGSAKESRNIDQIFQTLSRMQEKLEVKIPTGELNRFLERAMHRYFPPMVTGKRLRIYYLTQIDSTPPTFLLFVNFPHLVVESYLRYLKRELALHYKMEGIPIIFKMSAKRVNKEED